VDVLCFDAVRTKRRNGRMDCRRMSNKDAIIRTTSKSRAPSLVDEAFVKYDDREDEGAVRERESFDSTWEEIERRVLSGRRFNG